MCLSLFTRPSALMGLIFCRFLCVSALKNCILLSFGNGYFLSMSAIVNGEEFVCVEAAVKAGTLKAA
jgi:hypothetical protein